MKTKQEIFNKVVTHLRKQGRKAMRFVNNELGGSTFCAYRTSEGLCCAIGCLIPEDKYRPSMESGVVTYNQEVQSVLLSEGINTSHAPTLGFLRTLQLVHDTNDFLQWEERLQEVAITNELQLPEMA